MRVGRILRCHSVLVDECLLLLALLRIYALVTCAMAVWWGVPSVARTRPLTALDVRLNLQQTAVIALH